MFNYILQTISFQLIFLLAYEIFHKKDTFFTINRAYLLLTSFVALLLPLIPVSSLQETIPNSYMTTLPAILIGEHSSATTVKTISDTAITTPGILDTINWWILIYSIGAMSMLFIFIKRIVSIHILNKKSTTATINQHPVRIVKNSTDAFTFWNTIYIGSQLSSTETELILAHEIIHLKEKHSLDMLWFEFCKIFFWFNPMVYLYHNKMIALHEYISDASAIKTYGKQAYYEQLLNSSFQTKNIKFVNNFFNQKLLKKRILMLQKANSKTTARLKYLTLIPLLVIMVMSVAFSKNATTAVDTRNENHMDQSAILLEAHQTSTDSVKAMPFAVIETPPKTQNCKHITGTDQIKRCVSDEIKNFVNKKFDIKIAENLGLSGINRIYVRFKIDTDGKITDIQSRGPAVELEEEAVRVIQALPEMIPGENKGHKVNVLFALPIVFKIPSTADTDTRKKNIKEKQKITEETVLTENLSDAKDSTIEKGYYLITNIFKHQEYMDRGIDKLKKQGLRPKFFHNPKDNYKYVYLERYDTLEEAKTMFRSNFNNHYSGDLYILKIL